MQAILPGSSENAKPRAGAPGTDEETAAACRALARAAEQRNVCIRIAISGDGSVEAFVLQVPDSLKPATEAYGPKLTRQTLSEALKGASIGYEELVKRLERRRRGAKPSVPAGVVWSEPGLVIGGFATGFVKQWRQLKHGQTDESSDDGSKQQSPVHERRA